MPTDEQLALQVQRGDVRALGELVDRHYDRLIGYLYRLLGGDRTLAEDLVQETFLKALDGIRHYRHPRPFKPWLYAIATNLARNHYRRAETRHAGPRDADALAALPDAASGPEDESARRDEARQVALGLAALPAHQREAVVLRYYQELSLAEIADALAIPVGTVKSRLSLGLARLAVLLGAGE